MLQSAIMNVHNALRRDASNRRATTQHELDHMTLVSRKWVSIFAASHVEQVAE